MPATITSFKRAAKILKVRPETIGDIVRHRRISYDVLGMVKGLGEESMQELTAILSPPERRRNRAS